MIALLLVAASAGIGSFFLTNGSRSSFLSQRQASALARLARHFASESGEKHPRDALIVRSNQRHAINVLWRVDAAVANQRVFVITLKGSFVSPHGPMGRNSSLTFVVDPARNDLILGTDFNQRAPDLAKLGQVERLDLTR